MDECRCATDQVVREWMRNEAREFLADFAQVYGERCNVVTEIAIQEYVARLVHFLVMMEEAMEEGVDSDEPVRSMTRSRDTYQRVEDRMKKLADGIQPFVARAMADIEGENSARN